MPNKPTLKPLNSSSLEPLKKGWRWVRLGEVCKFEYGSALPERDRLGGEVPVFGSNGVVGYHNIAITQGPTIIIGRKGSIGQINFSKTPCWPIDTTYFIDSSKTQCDLIWLYWLLKWLKLDSLNKATGVPGLNREDAYDQLVPLPPTVEEQRCIAAKIQELMQEVERARAACEKQLEAAKALPAAYLRQVFESEEAKKWERRRLGEVCKFEYGSGLPERDRAGGSVPVFGSNGVVGYHNVAITQGPTIVIGRKGSIGQVNYSEVACWPIDTTYYVDSSTEVPGHDSQK